MSGEKSGYLEKQPHFLKGALDDIPSDDELGVLLAIEEKMLSVGMPAPGSPNLRRIRSEDVITPATHENNLLSSVNAFYNIKERGEEASELRAKQLSALKSGEMEDVEEAPEMIEINSEDERQETMLRRRPAVSTHSEDYSKDEEDETEGLFGTKIKGLTWTLANYFESVGSTKEKRAIAITAWIVTAVGLAIALAFLTKDFLAARESASSTFRHELSEKLALPDIQVCNVESSFPPFLDLPNDRYKGQPTFWIDAVLFPGRQHRLVKFPHSHNKSHASQIEVVAFDQYGKECKAIEKADPVVFLDEMSTSPTCFYCFYIKRDPPIVINRSYGSLIGEGSSRFNSMLLRLSKSKLLENCRLGFAPPGTKEKRLFRALIEKHASELQKRRILDTGGLSPDNPKDCDVLFPHYRKEIRDYYVRDVFDMYCNVYLFSGYFYPADNLDIRYEFRMADRKQYGFWRRTGRGTYFPRVFNTWVRGIPFRSGQSSAGLSQTQEEFFESDLSRDHVSRGDMVVAFTNASMSGRLEQVSVQSPGWLSEVAFERHVIEGNESFSRRLVSTKLNTVDVRGMDFVYLLRFGFHTFVTRTSTQQSSVSPTAFVADFFGLISLFMDVSVYTVIVSPLMVRSKRKRAMARAEQENRSVR